MNKLFGLLLLGLTLMQIPAEQWEIVLAVAGALVSLVAAAGGTVAIVNWVKNLFGWEGQMVHVLSWLVASALGILTAVVNGQITPELFASDPATIINTLVLILFTAVGAEKYYRFRKDQGVGA